MTKEDQPENTIGEPSNVKLLTCIPCGCARSRDPPRISVDLQLEFLKTQTPRQVLTAVTLLLGELLLCDQASWENLTPAESLTHKLSLGGHFE